MTDRKGRKATVRKATADMQPCDKEGAPALRLDGTELEFVEKRPIMVGITGTLKELIGSHVEMDISEADARALPQLNPKVEMQFRWMQFIVWRKWMAGAALAISLVILAVTASDTYFRHRIWRDKIRRCEAGKHSGFEKTYDPSYGPTDPDKLLQAMLEPFPDKEDRYAHTKKYVNSTTSSGHDTSGNMIRIAECRWAPFAPFQREKPATPKAPSSQEEASPFAKM
jgi:hypothetical protein